MTLRACITNAVNAGLLDARRAQEALELFDALARSYAGTMPPGQAAAQAAQATVSQLRNQATSRARTALLQATATQAVTDHLNSYRGGRDMGAAVRAHLEAVEGAPFSSVEARKNAIRGEAHRRLEQLLARHRRTLLGRPRRVASLRNLVREAFGEQTGDAAANQLARAWSDTAEALRLRFNRAGGEIGRLADWGLPQQHDSLRVRRAGYTAWRAEILPLLDPARMRDPITGGPMTPARFEEALKAAYDAIATDGYSKLRPSGVPAGRSLANQRADHRFLIFRDADAWLGYQDRFGGSDPYSAMMAHIDGMARDIAFLEVLGPNPAATLRYMTQLAEKAAATRDAHRGGTRALDQTRRQLREADHMFDALAGAANAPINGRITRSFAGLRSFLTAAQLGSAAISAITDLNFQRIAARHAGISYARVLANYAKLLNPASANDRELAVSLGLIAEGWSTIASSQMRYVGEISGSELTRRLSDFVLRASFLSPWTEAGRWAFGMEFSAFLARQAGKAWADLPRPLRQTFERYGLAEADWNTIRSSPVYAHGGARFIRAADVTDELVGTRLLEVIQSETQFAVPQASVRGRVAFTGGTRPGTFMGEVARSVAMYKNFGVTLAMTHIHRGLAERGLARKGVYFADLVISTTIAGALALQLKEIAKGKDPREMFGEKASAFWGAALMQGGGLGIFGDFLFSDVNRFGSGLATTIMGPVLGFLDDARRLTLGNVLQLPGDTPTNAGRELTNFLKRYTPGGSIWYARLGYERLILDRLAELTDPKARQRFRALESKARRDFGQSYYWRPGEAGPSRGPDLGEALGGIE